MTERIFIRWTPTAGSFQPIGRVFYGEKPSRAGAYYVHEIRPADLLRVQPLDKEPLEDAIMRAFPFDSARVQEESA